MAGPSISGTTTASQRQINEARVLAALRSRREISRIDIARLLGLDRSTITNIISRLEKTGIIRTISAGSSPARGGRKPILLGLNGDFASILGIEIQLGSFRAALVDLTGRVLATQRGELTGSPANITETLIEIHRRLLPDLLAHPAPLTGIGLGIPGIVNPARGTILRSAAFDLENFPLAERIAKRLPVPILIENDANCCAWSALGENREEGLTDFLALIMEHHQGAGSVPPDQDLGIGIVTGGRVYYGSAFASGELPCRLVPREERVYQRIYGAGARPENEDYRAYFAEVFTRLIPVIAVLNPSHLFLGGEFTLRRQAAEEALSRFSGRLAGAEIRFAEAGAFEVARGAALMFLERLFTIPSTEAPRFTAEISWDALFGARRPDSGVSDRGGAG